ncbi:MAG: DUF2155 domain-containing protein [Bdellovibrionales bacterium]
MNTRYLFALGVGLMALFPVSAYAVVPTQEQPYAVVRALDKMTARVEEITLPVGKAVSFMTLNITAKTCKTTLPEETPPESSAYLDVTESKGEAKETPVFKGWMFASSPALSAMEHPIYDIWVIGCRDKTSSSNSSQ